MKKKPFKGKIYMKTTKALLGRLNLVIRHVKLQIEDEVFFFLNHFSGEKTQVKFLIEVVFYLNKNCETASN